MAELWSPNYKDVVVLDIETYDPELSSLGPGVYHDPYAKILGCGVYNSKTNIKKYYPLHHTDLSAEFQEQSKAELKEILAEPTSKLLANAGYDLDWLENKEGLAVNGFIHDVQVAEPLLDAYKFSYSLDALAKSYNVPGKQTIDIEAEAQKLDPTHRSYKHAQELLWLMSSTIVGNYCIGDLEATYSVFLKQMERIRAENMEELYECECNLVRIRLMMRRNGILIDQHHRSEAITHVQNMESELQSKMFSLYGPFNINSSAEIAPILQSEGIKLPKTKTGKLSVTKDILEKYSTKSEFCAELKRARALNKLRTTFLEKSIDEHICPDGRIHGEFYPLKKDDAGTITGRWSAANPNLQQIPRNDEELGALVRGMFIPDPDCWYGHTDYSQVEYRVFSHYARGWKEGDKLDLLAQKMRADFVANPHMDYHQYVIDLVKAKTGKVLSRPTAKRVNFGTLYFMGEASLSNKFNIPYEEACEVFEALFHALPFIESTRSRVVNSVRLRGYLTTFCGRRQRIGPQHVAEGNVVHTQDGRTVVGLNKDGDKYYPFFNYLIQGTAADIMKFSLVEAYKQGVYDVLKLHLLVHDETGTSIPKTLEGIQAYQAQQEILSNTVKLKVPILAEADYGPNWGEQIEGKEVDIYKAMKEEIGL